MRYLQTLTLLAGSLVTLSATAVRAHAQLPRIGIIDYYGNRTVPDSVISAALGLQVGDSLRIPRDRLIARIRRIPGVLDAAVAAVCCDAGRAILYVGVQDSATPQMQWYAPPIGTARLPADIIALDSAMMSAMVEGLQKGVNGEDDSRGYSMFEYAPANRIQQQLVEWAPAHVAELGAVLRTASDAQQRALAAELLPLAGPSQSTIDELVRLLHDPDDDVRNNAMRALAILGIYIDKHPDAELHVPVGGFIDLLNSLVWTDRNKASFALLSLTTSRDSATLERLSDRAFDALTDIARWQSPAHAAAGLVLLGRIAGMTDDDIFAAMLKDPETVIRAAAAARSH
jgi:hypothetical protein